MVVAIVLLKEVYGINNCSYYVPVEDTYGMYS
jgi:hypothetical protein